MFCACPTPFPETEVGTGHIAPALHAKALEHWTSAGGLGPIWAHYFSNLENPTIQERLQVILHKSCSCRGPVPPGPRCAPPLCLDFNLDNKTAAAGGAAAAAVVMWQAEVGTPSSPSFVGMMNFGLKCSHNTRAAAASQKYKMIDLRNWMVF